ncbi:MAG: 30S ribosomal protein S13 [bacterium]|nr:30S ribosomal protein S13 [bacterium]
MRRLSGVDLPEQKRVDIGLTAIYGIGRANVRGVLTTAEVNPATRVKDLSETDIARLQKAIEGITVEGELRRFIAQNIKRMEDINTYRGLRHRRKLPVRGQRTRSNARTKRGKRMTMGTVRKDKAQPGTPPAGAPAAAGAAPAKQAEKK